MKNFVEYHIQEGSFHTFKVEDGETVKIGQMVKVTGDRSVSVAGAGDNAIGVVYSGTVGKDGRNVGYLGDEGDVVTVVALKPLVYLEASGTITPGTDVVAGPDGTVAVATEEAGGPAVGHALESANAGDRFLVMLG